ncbi:MAG: FAD-binding protein [Actinobacteria bacterium]|nr:FAD-binding protein [Actinomycetota bacterium]
MMDKIKNILKRNGLLESSFFGFDLSKLSSIKTGGRCSCFVTAHKRNELLKFLGEYISLGMPALNIYPVGDATNILFADGDLPFLLLKLGKEFDYLEFNDEGNIAAGSACKLTKFVVETARRGYDFSFLAGIPGTLGGAVTGSSGTADKSINSMVEKISIIQILGKGIKQSEIVFNESTGLYRLLKLPGLFLVTDIFFRQANDLPGEKAIKKGQDENNGVYIKDVREDIFKKIRENIKTKKNRQPASTKNIGCIFKNPQNGSVSAGKIIDGCGFKGFKYGGAMVSEKHANFIINTGNAVSKDIYTLAEIIRQTVRNKKNIELEYEIKMAGF